MKLMFIRSILLALSLFISGGVYASTDFDAQRPDDVTDAKWASLKAAVQEAKLLPTPEGIAGSGSWFGDSVSVEGNRALIGASNAAGNGAVYVMEFDGTAWMKTAVLRASSASSGDLFGHAVSLSGNRALVGAHYDDQAGNNSGAAYLFERDSNTGVWTLINKITANDAASDDQFGYSVSLYDERAVVGAYFDDDQGSNSGSAYVFDLVSGVWVQTQKLTANDTAVGDRFGVSVSLSPNRILIGASHNEFQKGSAYVFDLVSGVWSQTQKLTANDAIAGDRFGISVSLANQRALIGAWGANNSQGASYVFDLDNGNWVQSGKLVANDGAATDLFGGSVSLSGDRALIGARYDDDNGSDSGSAYVFDLVAGTWTQTAKIKSSDGSNGANFGEAVALSGDRMLIGAHFDEREYGSAYVFDLSAGTWVQKAKLTDKVGAGGDYFGQSVSIFGDRALIGAQYDDDQGNDSGAAYVFEFVSGSWVQTAKLTANDGAERDYFGYSVSLSGDRALIGAYSDDDAGSNSGSTYVFDLNLANGLWTQTTKLTANDGSANDLFGSSVSLSGDRALIGAWGDDDKGERSGSAYVFDLIAGNWMQTIKLTANDGVLDDRFGSSVSLSGDRALIGAHSDDDKGNDSGSVYVFDLTSGSWAQTVKLTANDGAAGDYFGYSVSLSGNRALIGAYLDDDQGDNSGSAYVFDLTTGGWMQTAKLVAADGATTDLFAYSVSLSGGRALISAIDDDDQGSGSGSAYVFALNAGTWTQVEKLTASDGAASDQFGHSVSLSDDRVLIGAVGDDDRGNQSGSAYVINLAPKYDVNVTVSGLATGSSIEVSNGGVTNIVDAASPQTMFNLDDGSSYAVTITSPSNPEQTCNVRGGSNGDGSGVLAGADAAVAITCVTTKYNVNVTVAGLTTGSSIEVSNDGVTNTVDAASPQTAFNLDDGSSYTVSMANPTNPNQACTVTGGSNNDGSGVLAGADVTVTITCVTTKYNVNVTVNGLATGSSIEVSNGGVTNTVNAASPQTMFNLDDGSSYTVTTTNPTSPNQVCTVTGGSNNDGSGALAGADVVITITCVTTKYNVNVTVNGLATGSSIDVSNGGVTNTVDAASPQTAFNLDDGSNYAVITTNPSSPKQTCTMAGGSNGDGSGVLAGADAAISIACVTLPDAVFADGFE